MKPCAVFLFLVISCTWIIHGDEILNCTTSTSSTQICKEVCNEPDTMKYSSTFCESGSGDCICDCRDIPSPNCTRDPDSDCNLYCETKNPNPEVFTYIGTYCPVKSSSGATHSVCSCMCYYNADYNEVNDI